MPPCPGAGTGCTAGDAQARTSSSWRRNRTASRVNSSSTTPRNASCTCSARPSVDRRGAARVAHVSPHAARDGLPIPVYVTHPKGSTPKEPLPAVVLVHGGPWVRGSDRRWEAEAQFLASRGYRVLQPEFRGSEGYGFAHFRAGWQQWGLTMQDDLADAVQWAAAQGLVDPARVCIVGASYGGYAALMAPVRHPDRWRCAASFAGVTDIDLMFSSERSDVSERSKRYGYASLIGDPKADAAKLRQNSTAAPGCRHQGAGVAGARLPRPARSARALHRLRRCRTAGRSQAGVRDVSRCGPRLVRIA